jgi:3-oxoacyl-[acyl-carrier protein] reductase
MYDDLIAVGLANKVAETKEDFLKIQAKKMPLGEIAQPEDVTHPIVFLAGEESRFITGISILTDGGAHLLFGGF